jgi:hypothetical protein
LSANEQVSARALLADLQVETKWKHRRIARLGDHGKILI